MNLSIPLYALVTSVFLRNKSFRGGSKKQWNCAVTFFNSEGTEPPLEMKNTIIKLIQSQIKKSQYFSSITKKFFNTFY